MSEGYDIFKRTTACFALSSTRIVFFGPVNIFSHDYIYIIIVKRDLMSN